MRRLLVARQGALLPVANAQEGVDFMKKRKEQEWKAKLDSTRGMAQWIAIYQAYNAIFKLAELDLLSHRLSLPQIYLLGVLKAGGGMLTTGEIGRAMVRQSQTMTGLVDRLEEPGLVERVFDTRDRRKTWVRLTEKGDRKLEEALPVATRLAEELFSPLSDQELAELQASVDKLGRAATDKLAATLLPDGSMIRRL
jgi:DNA-binding MarR family transcriptional regulator